MKTGAPRQDPADAGRGLLAHAFARESMLGAWKRVKANKETAGVDGLDIAQAGQHGKIAHSPGTLIA